MKHMTEEQKTVLDWLAARPSKDPAPVRELAEACFFSQASGLCLILQPEKQMAVLFLPAAQFDDSDQRQKQVLAFHHFVDGLDGLSKEGQLSFYHLPKDGQESTRFYSPLFQNPRREKKVFILNDAGLYSAHPESMKTKDGNQSHKGIAFHGDFYRRMDPLLADETLLAHKATPAKSKSIKPLNLQKYIPEALFGMILITAAVALYAGTF